MLSHDGTTHDCWPDGDKDRAMSATSAPCSRWVRTGVMVADSDLAHMTTSSLAQLPARWISGSRMTLLRGIGSSGHRCRSPGCSRRGLNGSCPDGRTWKDAFLNACATDTSHPFAGATLAPPSRPSKYQAMVVL